VAVYYYSLINLHFLSLFFDFIKIAILRKKRKKDKGISYFTVTKKLAWMCAKQGFFYPFKTHRLSNVVVKMTFYYGISNSF
jgi:hypothetical protein